MTLHRSRSLLFTVTEGELVGFNFLQKSGFNCSSSFLDILAEYGRSKDHLGAGTSAIADWLKFGAFVEDGTEQAFAEQEFVEKWEWGLPAALYHFCVQGNEMRSLEEGETRQKESFERLGLPELFCTNTSYEIAIQMDRAALDDPLLSTMARRRSNREPANSPVALTSIAKILHAGMGIIGFTNNSIVELPLTMTPSGGARNPYEAYLFARNINGLEPGIYHYSALEHSLGRLAASLPENLSLIVGGQDWAEDMAGIIVLAAHFERTMWKYDDPNAYRVVLIEAGHIGQNLLLAATDAGLAACPTAALSHELLFEKLALPSRITCAPIYAIAFGAVE